ncbi:MAG: hypothetical protein A3E88_01685 [Legionellales bacterium RIFCSPHIGHO2_12_FULL_35_11]|nr:MAG: hypothetical protein A3E88_01685 [Legionellales bacterium RIFCSPHIGHO2_12_FULL_35_11]
MSAIAAIYLFKQKSVRAEELHLLNSAMTHHGQDGDDIWLNGCCGLAQQTTHLTKESLHEHYPYSDSQNQIVLVKQLAINIYNKSSYFLNSNLIEVINQFSL